MSRPVVVAVLSVLTLLSVGCKSSAHERKSSGLELSQTMPSTQGSLDQYKSALASQCPTLHRDQLTPQQLQKETQGWYATLDTAARTQYDKSVKQSCAANATQPDCYNTGILVGAAQDGTMDKLVTQVCGPLQP